MERMALGTIHILAGWTGTKTVDDLPFQPTRILFTTFTRTIPTGLTVSKGIFSADKPDSGDFPQTSCFSARPTATYTWKNPYVTYIAAIVTTGPPPAELFIRLDAILAKGFRIRVYSNNIAEYTLIQWLAT